MTWDEIESQSDAMMDALQDTAIEANELLGVCESIP